MSTRLILASVLFMFVNAAMSQSSNGKYYTIRLKPHEDLRMAILQFATEHKIKAGAIVTCVGSLEEVNIRYANQPEGSVSKGNFEIVSLTGTFDSASSHIHISVSDKEGKTIGGHLLNGNLIYTTAEIVLLELTDLEFTREVDSTYGYKELIVKKRH